MLGSKFACLWKFLGSDIRQITCLAKFFNDILYHKTGDFKNNSYGFD